MNILHQIAERTKERIEAQKKVIPKETLMEKAFSQDINNSFPFEQALKQKDIAFICEIKKASPSKSVIAQDFPYLSIAEEYEEAGAAAISVLTEPYYFMGNDSYLQEISNKVKTPLLRKDFTVDSYMIYEAKVLGAAAVLLICAISNEKTLAKYIKITESLGLSALVETHDENEVKMALSAGARIIGVNNRDLKTFEIDMSMSERLRKIVPKDVLFVSESGINSPDDIAKLREIKADAVLIGESIMKSQDKKAEIKRLQGIPLHGRMPEERGRMPEGRGIPLRGGVPEGRGGSWLK